MHMLALLFAADAAMFPAAREIRRVPAVEATQGIAADARHLYAIANSEIGQYDRRTGRRLGGWRGDPQQFIHMNSCTLHVGNLVCAASNYPDVPQSSSIEWFDTRTMRHVRSRSLGPGRGSLTWLEWHDGSWWACFANYDQRGGEPGRDHRYTTLVRFGPAFKERGAWLFPASVLARMKPYSASGGAWHGDRLFVTGHDRREVYVMTLPTAGSRLIHVGSFSFSSPGQAIQWDQDSKTLWSIDREKRELVESRVAPEVER